MTATSSRAAPRIGLDVLAVPRAELGSLDHLRCVVKVLGFVDRGPGFTDALRGVVCCSVLLAGIRSDADGHGRSAVGVAELSFDTVAEVEAIVEVA